MNCWTVYLNPKDYPGQYVVRRFWIGNTISSTKPTNEVYVANSLEQVRAFIPFGLVCFPRNPQDDPVIVESWM